MESAALPVASSSSIVGAVGSVYPPSARCRSRAGVGTKDPKATIEMLYGRHATAR